MQIYRDEGTMRKDANFVKNHTCCANMSADLSNVGTPRVIAHFCKGQPHASVMMKCAVLVYQVRAPCCAFGPQLPVKNTNVVLKCGADLSG